MKNLAIIPARGGSKRIPRKNIKTFMGKPIIAYSIEVALQSGLFDEVMVSTDDDEIADIAQKYGARIPFKRSGDTANDYATTADVILEVIDNYKKQGIEFQNVCCIYATAPFVTKEILCEANHLLNKYSSVFTVVPFSYPVWRGLEIFDGKMNMIWPEYMNNRSQDLKTVYHDAGQFYFFSVNSFLKRKSCWGENTGCIILSELEVQDLDTEVDWKLAEMKYHLLHKC